MGVAYSHGAEGVRCACLSVRVLGGVHRRGIYDNMEPAVHSHSIVPQHRKCSPPQQFLKSGESSTVSLTVMTSRLVTQCVDRARKTNLQ